MVSAQSCPDIDDTGRGGSQIACTTSGLPDDDRCVVVPHGDAAQARPGLAVRKQQRVLATRRELLDQLDDRPQHKEVMTPSMRSDASHTTLGRRAEEERQLSEVESPWTRSGSHQSGASSTPDDQLPDQARLGDVEAVRYVRRTVRPRARTRPGRNSLTRASRVGAPEPQRTRSQRAHDPGRLRNVSNDLRRRHPAGQVLENIIDHRRTTERGLPPRTPSRGSISDSKSTTTP